MVSLHQFNEDYCNSSEIYNFFVYLRAICISFSVKYLFVYIVHFSSLILK
jgi:hypothetical protein